MAKGTIKINEDRCKGCELCISVCPVNVLALHESEINSKGYRAVCVTDDSKCIACANCAVMCPDGVISVYKED